MGSFIHFMSNLYKPGTMVASVFLTILAAFTIHRGVYWVIGFFFTRKFEPAKAFHKYAILIPARNEESVIGNLLNSIKRQDYPAEYLTVFVVADNCTDGTARVAREHGAICYEHNNPNERTKGFGLKYLFECIERDYKINSFEGYFVFDADNLLKTDYISRMNDSFDSGLKIITSYRNTKNFDENWVASTYALHWLRSIRQYHRARSFLRLATTIQGTGFLFSNELVKDGWKYTSLTEDRAFTADAVVHGYQISYNDEAVFYDEQPVSLRIALRQRIRWAKGHLLAFVESGPGLFLNLILGNRYQKREKGAPYTKADFIEGIRCRFATFDVLGQIIPTAIFNFGFFIVFSVFFYAFYCAEHGVTSGSLFNGSDFMSRVLNHYTGDISVPDATGMMAVFYGVGLIILFRILNKISKDIFNCGAAIYVFFTERNRIVKIKWYKKVLYTLTWPVFDIIGRYAMYIALFMKVEWKVIPHKSSVTIEDIEKR